MSVKKERFYDWFYRVLEPKITGLGAGIAVVGALFKIQHYYGAGFMLALGLGIEAFIFFLTALRPASPIETNYDWTKVYPELEEGSEKKSSTTNSKIVAATAVADKILRESKEVTPETFEDFGKGVKKLNESLTQIRSMAEVSNASSGYVESLKSTEKAVNSLNKSISESSDSLSSVNLMTEASKNYHTKVQELTRNLASLNAVYEMELKDVDSHLKAMNRFYSNLTIAMDGMHEASEQLGDFKNQIGELSRNLSSMNKIYGSILNAMRS